MTVWEPEKQRPIWIQIAEELQRRIEDGTYPPGRQLPGIRGVAQEFGVAENTARKVLIYLTDQGYVSRVPNWGTFVRPRNEWGHGSEAQPGRENTEN